MVEDQLQQRQTVVDYLNEHGAATLDDIAGAVDLPREVVRNLTRQLQAERLVTRSGVDGGSIRYTATAPPHPAIAEQAEQDAATSDDADDGGETEVEQRDSEVLDYIRSTGGAKTSDVADHLGESSDVAYAAINRLREDGLVVKGDTDEETEVEQRDSDVLDYIRGHPGGVTTAAVADELGVTSDTAYASIRRLVDDGLAVKGDTDGRAALWQPATEE